MAVLIILNIILIILVVFLVLYLYKNKRDANKNVCVNDECDEIETESGEHEQNNNLKSERVFVGRFVTDEEYQQIIKSRRSDISMLLKEVDNEYEHLKELSK